jgi:SHS2 domain-containing protein
MSPQNDQAPYVAIDHTADVGFIIRGQDRSDLFRNASHCLFDTLGGTEGIQPTLSRTLSVEAQDVAALLRAFLSELLDVSYVQKLVLVECEVTSLTDTLIEATVQGVPYDEARHDRNAEVKAITYHDLAVTQKADHWEATVIFDM